jgi:phasin family protein
MLTNEQITSVQKSNLQALLSLGNKAFESLESLVALNLQVTKTALDDAAEASLSTLSAKDPQSLYALQMGALQPSTEKATAYGRRVYEIATSMKTEIAKVVGDSAAGAQGSFIGLFDAAAKNAPLGSDNGVALWKSAVATANNAFESLQKAAKQASDIAEANYTAVTAQAVKSTQGSGKAKRG